jgi:hypothetical protein
MLLCDWRQSVAATCSAADLITDDLPACGTCGLVSDDAAARAVQRVAG